MSAIFLMRGSCSLGRTQRDKDGNIVSETPAQFTADKSGGSIAVGELDSETMTPKECDGIYGDWDAAGYLAQALKMLGLGRSVNIPDFKAIIQTAYQEDGSDLVCDYCKGTNCQGCIVHEWKEEVE